MTPLLKCIFRWGGTPLIHEHKCINNVFLEGQCGPGRLPHLLIHFAGPEVPGKMYQKVGKTFGPTFTPQKYIINVFILMY